jgi:hypothetical protein
MELKQLSNRYQEYNHKDKNVRSVKLTSISCQGLGHAKIYLHIPYTLEAGIFPFTAASRPALGPTQPPIQWVPRALSLGVKRPGREADHSPPSSAEVKE